jgi:hypothetical protein
MLRGENNEKQMKNFIDDDDGHKFIIYGQTIRKASFPQSFLVSISLKVFIGQSKLMKPSTNWPQDLRAHGTSGMN